jgi:hypothetical protein
MSGTPEDQFAAAIEGTTEFHTVAARQVGGGFVLNGQTSYRTDLGIEKMSRGSEGVAATAEEAATALSNYLTTGKFSG